MNLFTMTEKAYFLIYSVCFRNIPKYKAYGRISSNTDMYPLASLKSLTCGYSGAQGLRELSGQP